MRLCLPGPGVSPRLLAPPSPFSTGGAGVTLTAGTHVVLCEPLLNPTFEEQVG